MQERVEIRAIFLIPDVRSFESANEGAELGIAVDGSEERSEAFRSMQADPAIQVAADVGEESAAQRIGERSKPFEVEVVEDDAEKLRGEVRKGKSIDLFMRRPRVSSADFTVGAGLTLLEVE